MSSSRTVIDELASVLFALDEGSRSTSAVTALITREIARWALAKGWSVQAEARVGVESGSGSSARPGFIDVIVRRGGLERDLAIEIDSTDKPWSLAKLRHAAHTGMHAVWIRWGDDVFAGAYDDVDVIQLPVRRRSSPRSRSSQLTLWPRPTN
jgi:hypothetical protein